MKKSKGLLCDPVLEEYRVNSKDGTYSGTFSLAYPSKTKCIAMGLISSTPPKLSQWRELIAHVKSKGRTELIFYRNRDGCETEKVIKL